VPIDPTVLVGLAAADPGRVLFLGLFGVLACAILALHADHTMRTFGGAGSNETKTNCSDCGARIAAATKRCGHCGHSLSDGEEPRSYATSRR
jgi:hypothetical protein